MRKLVVPEAILNQHTIVLGKTGSGKSSKMRLLVEHLLDEQLPVTIIDPKGDWWGLRSSADGKRGAYPLVIFGGDHADVPINAHAGAALAELVATGNRPCLIDLRGWMPGDRTRFFIDFASTLFKTSRGIRHLIIDEVHNFAPKGKVLDPDAGKMLHWANRLASEGRGLGLTITAASQRPQKVHNDFLTSCETLIAARVIHKADRVALKEWVDGAGDPEHGKELLRTIGEMPRNEAWVWSPEIGFGPERIAFPMFRTFDSFKPQGADAVKLAGWATVDLEQVKAKLSTVIQKAAANDPAALKREIADLRRQLQAKAGATKAEVETAEVRGFETGRLAGRMNGVEEGFAAAISVVRQHSDELLKALDTLKRQRYQENDARLENPERRVNAPPGGSPQGSRTGTALTVARARQIDRRAPSNGPGEVGSGGKRRMLIALAQHPEGLNQRKLSILTDISASGGTWRTYMAELRSNGWVEGGREHMRITDAGVTALGDWDPLPIGQALIDYWRQRLGDSGKRAIFDAVVNAGARGIPKEDVAEQTNIALTGGTWRTYLAELRGLQLIEGRDVLKASEDLRT